MSEPEIIRLRKKISSLTELNTQLNEQIQELSIQLGEYQARNLEFKNNNLLLRVQKEKATNEEALRIQLDKAISEEKSKTQEIKKENEKLKEILENSDVVVDTIPQRAHQIEIAKGQIGELNLLDKDSVIYAIGTYMSSTKYNAKNITRNILKTRDMVNVIPYNTLFFESTQEGTIVDLFLSFMKIREKDANYEFVKEVNKLSETIIGRVRLIQMKKGL